jgi:hypothetical protein
MIEKVILNHLDVHLEEKVCLDNEISLHK